MIKNDDKKNCSGCRACYNICPTGCISMERDNEGFLYPIADGNRCANCGMCEKVCPFLHKKDVSEFNNIAFACQNRDTKTRLSCSSGGVFPLLCDIAVQNGGTVFGASFDEADTLVHCGVKTVDECQKFRGSKYLQSDTKDTYKEIQQLLKNGDFVLFSGTPCQCDGLHSFLGHDYENLLIVDFACHGVPSPLVFEKYLCELENKYGSNVVSVNFRDKKTGWKNYCVDIAFKNGKRLTQKFDDNIFMRGFLSDLYLRPSCHNCMSNSPSRSSDITLADYWGVSEKHSSLDDNTGTSLVIINSDKGKKYFDNICAHLKYEQADIDHAIANNPCIIHCVAPHKNRGKFFSTLSEKSSVSKLIAKNINPSLAQKIRLFLYRKLYDLKNK